MPTIAFRHELPAANVRLVARLGFDVVVDVSAPSCVRYAGGRAGEFRVGTCRRCRRLDLDATCRPLPSRRDELK